jgi:hypothetical protein
MEETTKDLLKHIKFIPVTNEPAKDFNKFLKNREAVFDKVWRYMSTVSNSGAEASMNLILDRLTPIVTIKLSDDPKTIDELLREEGFVLIPNATYDYLGLVKDIFFQLAGIHILKVDEMKHALEVFQRFLKNMTSYTLHILKDNLDTKLAMPYTTVDVINGINLANIVETEFQCLEEFNGDLAIRAIDIKDRILVINRPNLSYEITDPSIRITGGVSNVRGIEVVRGNLYVTKEHT